MRSSIVLSLAGLALHGAATPVAVAPPLPHSLPQPRSHHVRQDNSNSTPPCARVSQAMYPNGTTPNTRNLKIPAGIAMDCLNSIPLSVPEAKALLRSLPTYIQWQSTLTALKNPPAEYKEKVQPPTDILGGLKLIEADIDAGKLASEYEFGWSLYTLIHSAHDGHFAYIPDSVGAIFSWGRDMPLVSVSEDGQKLPSVFAFHDVLGSQFKNISYTPSAITQINGEDVSKYLEHFSQAGGLQDRDALYNNMFYSLAQVSLGMLGSATGMFAGNGRARFSYPGPTTTLTFANGTSLTFENWARPIINFQNIQSGEDLRDKVLYFGPRSSPSLASQVQANDQEVQMAAAEPPPGYPTPVVPGPDPIINGYFLDAPGYEDVAILQVPNFVVDVSAEKAFQKTTQEFIRAARDAGKSKVIIDLQANGGGTILQGYDMFKQFFPAIEPLGLNRLRAHPDLDAIGQSYSSYASRFPRGREANYTVRNIQATYFDYHMDMTVDGKPFGNWSEKFGPVETNGDLYTTTHRWNLSDVHIEWSSGGINITGYGPLANVSREQPFKAEDIVLLTDGYCASTCSIFTESMTKQAGVKTIALGGRSNNEPMQAVGGVKGTNNFQWSYIQQQAVQAVYLADSTKKAEFNATLGKYMDDTAFFRTVNVPGVNSRDGLALNDDSGVALQFLYEEADCRLYYTPEMTVDITAVWKAAADAQWGDSSKCVGHSGYAKRSDFGVTTNLKRRRLSISQAAAQKQYEAFERTFGLKTQCTLRADGFMNP